MNEILTALYTRLSAQLTQKVYDHVPQDQDFPFVVFSVVQTDNQDTDTEEGFSGILRVTSYSNYRGFGELATIADNITSALNNWDMANTATYTVGTFKETFRQYTVSPDGLKRFCVQEYNFFYETT